MAKFEHQRVETLQQQREALARRPARNRASRWPSPRLFSAADCTETATNTDSDAEPFAILFGNITEWGPQ
eukprot:2036393-Pyramimonas_sp.AAC.1